MISEVASAINKTQKPKQTDKIKGVLKLLADMSMKSTHH